MKSALIFYFSGTGNTWWLANTIKKKLSERNVQTTIISIESEKKLPYLEKIEEYELVGFGYPIYGSDCPLIFKDFMQTLPHVDHKDAFVFTSMLAFSGDGALVAEKHLQGLGFVLKQAVNTVMPNNLKLPYPVIDMLPIYEYEKVDVILDKAEVRMERLAGNIVDGVEWIEGRGPLGILGGMLQRGAVVFFGWRRWARNFFVDPETCTLCLRCVEHCPTGNINLRGGVFEWGDKCVCCVRCYNLCPVDAIQYKGATLDRNKFPRYKGPIRGYKTELLEPVSQMG